MVAIKHRIIEHTYHKVERAIELGLLPTKREKVCMKCGSKRTVERHHRDYRRPYEYIWLCRKCHKRDYHGFIMPLSPEVLESDDEHKAEINRRIDGFNERLKNEQPVYGEHI